MIVRPHYMDLLKTYRNVPLVKILAGIRRSGKSTILEMLKNGEKEEIRNMLSVYLKKFFNQYISKI